MQLSKASDHEIVVVTYYTFASASALVYPGAGSRALSVSFPGWALYCVYGGVVLGGLAILFAIASVNVLLRRESFRVLDMFELERAGLFLTGPLILAYGVAAVIVTGLPGIFAAAAGLAVGVAHIVRGIRISRQLGLFRQRVDHE